VLTISIEFTSGARSTLGGFGNFRDTGEFERFRNVTLRPSIHVQCSINDIQKSSVIDVYWPSICASLLAQKERSQFC
jgi:hypothetical protein